MKLFEITIQPTSGFGTPLKGDTLFGHFCWQAGYNPDILNGGLDHWVARYDTEPFAIFSSAWPKLGKEKQYAVKRPDVPPSKLFKKENNGDRDDWLKKRKTLLKRKWLLVPETLQIDLDNAEYITDEALAEMAGWRSAMPKSKKPIGFLLNTLQPRNAISRLTGTTGGDFSPFDIPCDVYCPGAELAIFALINEEATDRNRLKTGISNIGKWGYGKDGTTGRGRFTVSGIREIDIPAGENRNACYALGPLVPEKDLYETIYFSPFTRFGKHGDILARSKNPFKNPVIMADEGAVLITKSDAVLDKPYAGRAVRNLSLAEPRTIGQGYAVCLPLKTGEVI